jgi:hypothetical protein
MLGGFQDTDDLDRFEDQIEPFSHSFEALHLARYVQFVMLSKIGTIGFLLKSSGWQEFKCNHSNTS